MEPHQSYMLAVLSVLLVHTSCVDAAWSPAAFVTKCDMVSETLFCDPSVYVQDPYNITAQLAEVNNDTEGVINWDDVYYYGYIIAAAVVDEVQPQDPEGSVTEAVTAFGEGVQQALFGGMICDNSTLILASLNTSKGIQQALFGGMICDNSTLILASLNTSKIYLFPGAGTDTRLRTHHKEVCSDIRVDAATVEEGLRTCIKSYNKEVAEAMKPWSNAGWGYGGVVVIMTMLIFHYWIKY